MTRNYKKKVKPYNEVTLANACKEVNEGSSLLSVSKKYKIGYGKLRRECLAMKNIDGYEPKMNVGKRVSDHVLYLIYIYIYLSNLALYIYIYIYMYI